jgi:hypothetical protein
MSRTLMNLAALAILLAGSGVAMASRQAVRSSGGHCSSGDGTVSCDCASKCWADETA